MVAAINNAPHIDSATEMAVREIRKDNTKSCGLHWIHCRNPNAAAAACKTMSLCVIHLFYSALIL